MAQQEPTDIIPVFWPLSPSTPGSGSASRSEPDYDVHRHQDCAGDTMDSSDHLGLGLGLGFHNYHQHQDPINGDWSGNEFFIGRRYSSSSSGSESDSASEFSRARPIDHDGLRILGFESDSDDSDEQIVAIGDDQIQIRVQEEMNNPSLDLNLPPICWDCLRIDEDRNEEFEWEEIDGRLEEREVININQERDLEEEDDGTVSNVEWEVLWMNHLGNSEDAESFIDEGFVYTTSENDEVLFAQFQDHHDSLLKGSPPAAKSVVESLPTVVLTKEDVENKHCSISCAVCKDEIVVEEEKVKRMPCSHCYHEECILPWLGMRNTCPLCRYELPTDDPEYERWKARRAGNVVEDEGIRYDFEILPEA